MKHVASLALAFLGAGCAHFMAQLEGNPYGNWEMRAARVPTSSEDCVALCKERDEACWKHLNDPGMNGNAQEMEVCYENIYQCYLACPDATEVVTQYKEIQLGEAMKRACAENLSEPVYCMTRNGIIGQAIDP